jgi:hypothetical protein
MNTPNPTNRSLLFDDPITVQKLEGVVLLGLAALVYSRLGGSWWWFFGLLLVPDVAMLGYLAGPRVGAVVYNLVHTLVGPAVLAAVELVSGQLGGESLGLYPVAVIWVAHIAMDRALGYGLKLPSGFGHTHLSRSTHA